MGLSEVESKRVLSHFTNGTGFVGKKRPILQEEVGKWLHYMAKQTPWKHQRILHNIDMKIKDKGWPQISPIQTLMMHGMFVNANFL